MVKARRPSLGLGHLPVWLHPPQEPTVPLFLFQILSSHPFAFRRLFLTVWASLSETGRVRVMRAAVGPDPSLPGRRRGRCVRLAVARARPAARVGSGLCGVVNE